MKLGLYYSTRDWHHPDYLVGDNKFYTGTEKNPWAKVDLGAVKTVNAVVIENRSNERRTEGLIVSVSEDGQQWQEVWRARTWETSWVVPVTHFAAGANAPGCRARFIRVETKNEAPGERLLRRITVFGVK